jgi:hypothetical protein
MARRERFHFFYPNGPVKQAVAALDSEGRWAVLSAVPDYWGVEELIAALVGDDLELFERWLSTSHRAAWRLAPLAGRPTDAWAAKAKIAYRAGIRIDAIINVARTSHHFWSGEESDYWASWEHDFALICNHEDPDIRRLAEHGRKAAAERRADALKAERREDVYGTR